ncbi:MAG TPA: hypothetical protein DCZ11_01715 [Gammaproteobacteria bacterium]|nr:hypothetical protein [Gammaproteobacteria bacterium]MCH77142.1 hypothetical protein [Gammaproteobacteria bacterium]
MEYACGNVFIREMRFDGMRPIEGHAHNFAHTTYCARGAMRIEALADDGAVRQAAEIDADKGLSWALISAGVRHRITPLREGTIGHCIYSHRTPQGEVVQEFTGWAPAYE